jgi:VTC domain
MSETKLRYELKYVVNIQNALKLMDRCANHASYDNHGDENGAYEVASLYYDTARLRFHWDRKESVGYRRKVRLRSYVVDGNCTGLFLEIKEKHKSLIGKKRTQLNSGILAAIKSDHHRITLAELAPYLKDDAAVREVCFLDEYFGLLPTMMIRYVRKTLVGNYEPNLRITLDTRLTAGGSSLTKFCPKEESFFLQPNQAVFEIKSHGTLPIWLQKAVSEFKLFRVRYSKYCSGVEETANSLVNKPFATSLGRNNHIIADSKTDRVEDDPIIAMQIGG